MRGDGAIDLDEPVDLSDVHNCPDGLPERLMVSYVNYRKSYERYRNADHSGRCDDIDTYHNDINTYYEAINTTLIELCTKIQPDNYYSTAAIQKLLSEAIKYSDTEIISLIFSHAKEGDGQSLANGVPPKVEKILSSSDWSSLSQLRQRENIRRECQLVCQELMGPSCRASTVKRVKKQSERYGRQGASDERGVVNTEEWGHFHSLPLGFDPAWNIDEEGLRFDVSDHRAPKAAPRRKRRRISAAGGRPQEAQSVAPERIAGGNLSKAITVEQLKALSHRLPKAFRMTDTEWALEDSKERFVKKYFEFLTKCTPDKQQVSVICQLLFDDAGRHWHLGTATGSGKTLMILVSVILRELIVSSNGAPSIIFCIKQHELEYGKVLQAMDISYMPGIRIDVITAQSVHKTQISKCFGDASSGTHIVICNFTVAQTTILSPVVGEGMLCDASKKKEIPDEINKHLKLDQREVNMLHTMTVSTVFGSWKVNRGPAEDRWELLIKITCKLAEKLHELLSNDHLYQKLIPTIEKFKSSQLIGPEFDKKEYLDLHYNIDRSPLLEKYQGEVKGVCEILLQFYNAVSSALTEEHKEEHKNVLLLVNKIKIRVYSLFHLRVLHYFDLVTAEKLERGMVVIDDNMDDLLKDANGLTFGVLSQTAARCAFASATGEEEIKKYCSHFGFLNLYRVESKKDPAQLVPVKMRMVENSSLLSGAFAALYAFCGTVPAPVNISFMHDERNGVFCDHGRRMILFPLTPVQLLGDGGSTNFLLPPPWVQKIFREYVRQKGSQQIEKEIALFQHDGLLNELDKHGKKKEVSYVLDEGGFKNVLLNHNRFRCLQNLFAGELSVIFDANTSASYKLDEDSMKNIFSSSGLLFAPGSSLHELVCKLRLERCGDGDKGPESITLELSIEYDGQYGDYRFVQVERKFECPTSSYCPDINITQHVVSFYTSNKDPLTQIEFKRPGVVVCDFHQKCDEVASGEKKQPSGDDKAAFFLTYYVFLHHCLLAGITNKQLLLCQNRLVPETVNFAHLAGQRGCNMEASFFSNASWYKGPAQAAAFLSAAEVVRRSTNNQGKRQKKGADPRSFALLARRASPSIINNIVSFLCSYNESFGRSVPLVNSQSTMSKIGNHRENPRYLIKKVHDGIGPLVIDMDPESNVKAMTQGHNFKSNQMFFNVVTGLPIDDDDLEQAFGRVLRRVRGNDARVCGIHLVIKSLEHEIENYNKFDLHDRYMPHPIKDSCAWFRLKHTEKIISILYKKGRAGQIDFSKWVTAIDYDLGKTDKPQMCATAESFMAKITEKIRELTEAQEDLYRRYEIGSIVEKLDDERKGLYLKVLEFTLHVSLLIKAICNASCGNFSVSAASDNANDNPASPRSAVR